MYSPSLGAFHVSLPLCGCQGHKSRLEWHKASGNKRPRSFPSFLCTGAARDQPRAHCNSARLNRRERRGNTDRLRPNSHYTNASAVEENSCKLSASPRSQTPHSNQDHLLDRASEATDHHLLSPPTAVQNRWQLAGHLHKPLAVTGEFPFSLRWIGCD